MNIQNQVHDHVLEYITRFQMSGSAASEGDYIQFLQSLQEGQSSIAAGETDH